MSVETNDDRYPASSVVFIEARWGERGYTGSGFIVGKNDIITASHVIYNSAFGRIADEIIVYPSYDPDDKNNKGFSPVWVQYFPDFDPDKDGLLVSGDFYRTTYAGSEIDIALLSLNEDVASDYGSFGIDPSFSGGIVSVIGYPAKYNRQPMVDVGSVTKSALDNVYYLQRDLEVNPGNSGGPIYYDYGQGVYAVGVVSTGIAATAIGDHWSWLEQALIDNDKFLADGGPSSKEADLITGTNSSEILYGSSRNDYISGFDGNDRLFGVSGNDTLVGGRGNDILDGGEGVDVAVYSGRSRDYTATLDGQSLSKIVDSVGNRDGDDTLISIERLRFSDRNYAFELDGNAGEAYRIYEAAFNRKPDVGGLGYWIAQLDKGLSLKLVAEAFLGSSEFQQLYGSSLTNTAFVDNLYKNILDRAGEKGGVDYWIGQLNSGVSRADILVGFSESAENKAGVIGSIQNGIEYKEWLG